VINAVLSPGPKKILSTTTTFHLARRKFLSTTKLSPDPNKISPDHNSPNKISPDHNSPQKISLDHNNFHLARRKFLSTTNFPPGPKKISLDHKLSTWPEENFSRPQTFNNFLSPRKLSPDPTP
jgi:hypothetical protein